MPSVISRMTNVQKVVMGSTVCPCCGAVVATRAPLVDLTSNVLAYDGLSVRLPPAQAELVYMLSRRSPRVATIAEIAAALYGIDTPDNAHKCIQTFIVYIRHALAKWQGRLRIETINKRGYRLVVT